MKILPLISNNFPINCNLKSVCRINGSNLSPLKCDTVSFGHSKKADHSARPSIDSAQKLYDDSKYAFGYFKYMLSETFDDLKVHIIDAESYGVEQQIANAFENNKDKPIVMIMARRKSPNSIAEKMGSQHIKSQACAKRDLNDLIGAKIVLSGNSKDEGDYVLDKLTTAVKKGHLKIRQVKLHGQENKKLNYASNKKINNLVGAARKMNEDGLCTFVDEPRDSGYIALHILTDEIADGYKGEIQIMGLDVERFKELEDLCYKCHCGKSVSQKYKPMKELFKLIQDNPKLKKEFLEYTKRAYAYERQKLPHEDYEKYRFLDIPDDLNIPAEYNFNNILQVKKALDTKNPRSH